MMMDYKRSFQVLLIYLSNAIVMICTIHLNELRIPNHAIKEQSVRLECFYDLEGEALYSVKWYKDGNEFYRYVPREKPPVQVFQLPGVTVDLHNSSRHAVVLSNVNLSSSGRYRCEISGEAPSFQTVSDHGDMLVVVLPDEGPRITGGKPRYQIGDTVKINCTSGRSNPPTQLSWFINGEPADPHFLHGPYIHQADHEGLQTSLLGLEFAVKPKHFKNGDMKLKCLATIATVYWKSNEESVEGERPKRAPNIEIIKASIQSNPNRVEGLASTAASGNGLRFSFNLVALCSLSSLYLIARGSR